MDDAHGAQPETFVPLTEVEKTKIAYGAAHEVVRSVGTSGLPPYLSYEDLLAEAVTEAIRDIESCESRGRRPQHGWLKGNVKQKVFRLVNGSSQEDSKRETLPDMDKEEDEEKGTSQGSDLLLGDLVDKLPDDLRTLIIDKYGLFGNPRLTLKEIEEKYSLGTSQIYYRVGKALELMAEGEDLRDEEEEESP
jgi:DNA-directed RNA polymerase specialized sigma24 family protein